MQLSESYKKRIQELADVLEENRIQKLIAQKFPEEIIKFAKKFAELTTKEPATEENINRNQYIPWIADEAKKHPEIIKDKDKLSVIINWIKNSGYNKISVGAPFNQVYEKAKQWLESKNVNVNSGEKIEGGDMIHKFSDGSSLIKVNNINWCMKVGDNRGWCFKSDNENRAKEFIGLDDINSNNQGFMILDKDGVPKLAVQYNKSTGIVDDFQGAFNEIPDENIALDSIELLKNLPIINNIEGYRDTFWKTIEKYPKFYHAFKVLKNLNLPFDKKWYLQIPFTKEDVAKMSLAERAKYNLLSKEDMENLSDFSKNVLTVIKNPQAEPKEDLFLPNQIETGDWLHEIIFEDDVVKLDIDENIFDEYFSGMDESQRWYSNIVNYYDYHEEQDKNELEYMFNIGDENVNKLKEIAKMIGKPNYDFEEEGGIKNFIENYFPEEISGKKFRENIFDEYLINLGYAVAQGRTDKINKIVDEEQKFKYENGYLVLPYKDLYDLLVNKQSEGKNISSFKDLKDAEINGEIYLEDSYYDADYGDKRMEELKSDFNNSLDKMIDYLEEEGTDFSSNLNKSNEILKNLGFNDNSYLIKNNRFINIEEIDYANQRYKISFKEFPKNNAIKTPEEAISAKAKKQLKGWIDFDNLTNYVHNNMLFEIRSAIRKILEEDYRYQYDIHNYIPTDEILKTVQAAMNAVKNNNLVNSNGSNEGSGIKKAHSLMRKEPLTHNQLKRMKAFFDNNKDAVRQELVKGKNINNSSLLQTWNLWGGDAGQRWVEQMINSLHSRNDTSKTVRGASGIRTKRLMDPHNFRIRNEAYLDSSGDLQDFESEKLTPENEFDIIVNKWNANKNRRVVGYNMYEYWFPIDAMEDIDSLGINWYTIERVTNNKHPDYGKRFIVFTYGPKKS